MVRHLGEDDRLAARDRARAEDAGHRHVDQADQVRDEPLPARQGAAAVPAARRPRRRARRARSTTSSARAGPARRRRDRPGRDGRCRARSSSSARPRSEDARREALDDEGRVLQGLPRVALGEGAGHLDQALAPKLGLELVELESVTCCGAGDIHEAEPDYYLHLNARILAYGRGDRRDTLMTICNVCTLNLGRRTGSSSNDETLRARVNENLERVGVPPYSGRGRGEALALADRRGRGLEKLQAGRAQGLNGLQGGAVLRLPDPAPLEADGLRGSRPAERRWRRSSRPAAASRSTTRRRQVLRLPDHPGARGDRARPS